MKEETNEDTATMYEIARTLYGELALPSLSTMQLRRSSKTKLFEVYDILRRKYVSLTPEEWVRTHFVAYMIDFLNFSPHRMANEVTIEFNNMRRRADTGVYDDYLRPCVVVEYKASSVALTTDVLDQVLRYNQVFRAKAVMVTNGRDIYSIVNGRLTRGVVGPDDVSGI